jgi:hypothetical protein
MQTYRRALLFELLHEKPQNHAIAVFDKIEK